MSESKAPFPSRYAGAIEKMKEAGVLGVAARLDTSLDFALRQFQDLRPPQPHEHGDYPAAWELSRALLVRQAWAVERLRRPWWKFWAK